MKLFFKEHLSLVIMQIVQFFVILSIFLFDGYHDFRVALYAVFLGFFFLACYLFYNYYSRKRFYQRLSQPLEKLDDSLQTTDQTPISEALDHLMKEQYKHYQKQLMSLEKEQSEHLQFIDQWVHQMKTPLSVIELTAQNLDEPDSSSIREEIDRMKMGLNTVLYMARLRSIEQDFHIKPVMLADMIHEVNKDNKRFFIRNRIYPKLKQDREGILVETDEKWLFFMLSQLIHNAVKYSAGKSDRIDISICEREGEAVVEITDYGVGIPHVDKRRVFDPFFTGENGRAYRESTGMGLYLTMEVAKQLGHRVEFDSDIDQGSTFRMIFTRTQNLTKL